MDRRVKERLVGATILLGLVVVVVPELLSGPKPSATPPPLTLPVPMHSYTVDVANHSMAPTTTVAGVADTAASAVPSAASAASVPEPTASGTQTGAPSAEPLESVAPPPISNRGEADKPVSSVPRVALPSHQSDLAWGLQLGSFASKSNAEKLVRALAAKGYVATVSAAGSGATLRYRVRIGSLVDREAAERVRVRLKAQGQGATLLPPAP